MHDILAMPSNATKHAAMRFSLNIPIKLPIGVDTIRSHLNCMRPLPVR